MVRFHKFICATVCGALAMGTAHAGELPDPDSPDYRELLLMVEETGTIYTKATITRVQQSGNRETRQTYEAHARYLFQWDWDTEAFRVTKSAFPLKPADEASPLTTDNVDLSDMTSVFKTLKQITYLADESLSPLEILNWPELKENLRQTFRSVSVPGRVSADEMFNQLYGALDGETAAPYLLEIEFFSGIPHNTGLEIGKTLTDDMPLIVPFGNFPLDAQTQLTLTSWDEARNSARVHYVFAPKPEALNYFIREHLPQTLRATNAPPQVIKTIEEAFVSKSANDLFDSRTECHFDMAIDTGLIRQGECTKRIHINLLDEATTRTDKWTFSESFNP